MGKDLREQQHTVPKFYLQNFCNERGKLEVYDIRNNRIFPVSPDKICKERFVYETEWEDAENRFGKFVLENSIEKEFSAKESRYKVLIDKILVYCSNAIPQKHLICNTQEKQLLADFVANLHLRNPYVFRCILQESYPIEMLRKIELYGQINDLFDAMELGSPDSLIKHSVKQGLFDSTIENSPAALSVNQLLHMNLIFLRSLERNYVTSSRPVAWIFIKDDEGKDVCESVFLPLTPSILLLYTDDMRFRPLRNRLVDLPDSDASFYNQEYLVPIYEPVRFLIAKHKSDFENLEITPTIESEIGEKHEEF